MSLETTRDVSGRRHENVSARNGIDAASRVNTVELGGFSSAWLHDLAFYSSLEVEEDSR